MLSGTDLCRRLLWHMRGMKNVGQSSLPGQGKIKNFFSCEMSRLCSGKHDIRRFWLLVAISLAVAFFIGRKMGLSYFTGTLFITSFILFIFYKDIKRYKPQYLKNYRMLVLLGLLLTGTLLAGRVAEYFLAAIQKGLDLPGSDIFIYALPIPLGAMLVTLIFDFHTAIIFSFVISLLSGIWLNTPFYSIYTFIGSLTAAFSVIGSTKRFSIIKGGFYVSIVSVAAASVLMLFEGNLFSSQAPPAFMFAFLSGVFVSAVVMLLLPLIEYLFGLKTDISLMELLDLNQPLMRNLMINAPGTYHHSVIVGSLAEAAAEAVGANPMLAKVSAYYHDIGKVKMPEYFIENQMQAENKHEKLTPNMSSKILIAHVKEGVELARQHSVPESVIDIIQQHHGTSLITYFYQKAVEQVTNELPDPKSFRYPGPRPQTRIAAIVMMADAVEAASRSLADPTPARISALVEKIINHIFLDGQIDECELTLKDISEIKKRFTYILTGIFHRRIEYPTADLKPVQQQKGDKTQPPALQPENKQPETD
ncbi:MAG: HDIG domain-containing protein [Nitrospirae bacterium]|nr:HDIG domain-containing protein [Nitrospirota bacterium]